MDWPEQQDFTDWREEYNLYSPHLLPREPPSSNHTNTYYSFSTLVSKARQYIRFKNSLMQVQIAVCSMLSTELMQGEKIELELSQHIHSNHISFHMIFSKSVSHL